MATRKTSNPFLRWREGKKTFNGDNELPGNHSRKSGSSSQSRILDLERAERAALIQRAEKLCTAQKARSNAVLERLGFSVQHDTLPSPQPSAYPRRRPESFLQGGRIMPILDVEENSGQKAKTPDEDEADAFSEKKLHLGNLTAILGCKLACLTEKSRSPSLDTSISTVDTHTPNELRIISQMGKFSPSPLPTAATRRASRIPVMSRKLGGVGKEIANGCRLQERVEQFQLIHHPLPRPPAAPRRTPAVIPMVPTPPSKAALPKRKGSHHGKTFCPGKAGNGVAQEELQPFTNPITSMSLCFSQLSSENWEDKIEGFKSVRTLARYHPKLLQTKLHEVCLILAKEVLNLRSVVACAAINTTADLHVQLGKAMDPEAETTGRALLVKLSQTTNTFIHQQVNLALDALVEGCSPRRIMSALLNTGLSNRCAAVRASTAQHLHQLAGIVGENQTLTAGKVFAERFLTAVSKMSVDAVPEVRHHGLKMLQGLAYQKEFLALWNKLIPVRDRFHLDKILNKTRL